MTDSQNTSIRRVQAWSSGGGTQSTAIAALICMGELRPDVAVIVDTEREASETWEYLEKWVHPALQAAGVNLHRVPKSLYATVDLWGGKDGETLLIPAFTDQSGTIGKLSTYCSVEWKKRVIHRFLNTLYPADTKFNQWIGFSVDEPERLFQETGKWEPKFPLFDKRYRRHDCVNIVKAMGWPEPPRSSCWMCPNRSHAEWMHLKKLSCSQKDAGRNEPTDWEKAIEFEKEIQKKDPHAWLTSSCKPLEELPEEQAQADLFTGRCTQGNCFV